MTVAVEEAVVETSHDDEEEIAHISCHCTEHNLAWCGEDLSDIPLSEDGFEMDDLESCVLCKLVVEQMGDKRCPWGCTCSEGCGPIPVPRRVRGFHPRLMIVDEWLPETANRVINDQ